MSDYISTNSEWTFDLIAEYDSAIGQIAEGFKLDISQQNK
jgi:spore cortex formation protein SpoVR/YcgB (stage V sporulation)